MTNAVVSAGKTYIGVKLVHAILYNTRPPRDFAKHFLSSTSSEEEMGIARQTGPEIGPLLVVTFTNHALDQFLEGLIKAGITKGLVRMGSRSKSEVLQVDPFGTTCFTAEHVLDTANSH
jgi:hypothetical protein